MSHPDSVVKDDPPAPRLRLYKAVVKGNRKSGWEWAAYKRESGGDNGRWRLVGKSHERNQTDAVMAAARALMEG